MASFFWRLPAACSLGLSVSRLLFRCFAVGRYASSLAVRARFALSVALPYPDGCALFNAAWQWLSHGGSLLAPGWRGRRRCFAAGL